MSGFLSDATNSIIDNIKQKRKSPLYGAFAFSWLACNWKPVSIFILSKKDIYAKIQDVSAYASLNDQFILPAIMAVSIVLLMPTLHALYSYFDAVVGFIHDSSNSLKEWFNAFVNQRKERARAFESIQNEATLAEEKAKIAEFNRQAADAEQQEALIRADITSVTQLLDERIRLQKYELELNDKYTALERKHESLERHFHLYKNAGEYAVRKSDEIVDYIEGRNMDAIDLSVVAANAQDISQRLTRAQSGPVLS
ncbi:hypothetical protein FHW22_000658|uniref:hypothetical protein n=1 Tax=Enterobacter ludwigii TaxID=299767 RepID=UPI001618CE32|nr:hypothetical protein [Enterobacter ludwigii]MBB2843606.1 hypothetical protein [Enterobacter ludwigii]